MVLKAYKESDFLPFYNCFASNPIPTKSLKHFRRKKADCPIFSLKYYFPRYSNPKKNPKMEIKC